MACRIKIKKKLEETVDTLSQEGEGKSLPLAKQVANKVNNQFNTKVVDFVISGDYIDKVITIPDPLVDAYYDAQVELEVEEDNLTRRKQGNWTTDKEGNVIPFFDSKATTEGKMSIEEVTKFLNPFIKTLTDKFKIPVELFEDNSF
jgi:glutamate formiminotransferase